MFLSVRQSTTDTHSEYDIRETRPEASSLSGLHRWSSAIWKQILDDTMNCGDASAKYRIDDRRQECELEKQ